MRMKLPESCATQSKKGKNENKEQCGENEESREQAADRIKVLLRLLF